jgi:ABC-type bacteriocin/lantibiotic exporter with double-glycine peptidase domain
MNRFLFFVIPFGVLLSIVLAGCATTGQNHSSGIQLLSKHAVLLELPFEAQNIPNLCGVASVEMLTRYYGKRLTDSQSASLRAEAGNNQGVTGAFLKKTLEDAGYFVAVFPGTLDRSETSLYNHLDLKRPLIVMIGSGPRHYEVVTGYDPDNSLLVLLDPARGQVAVPIQNFAKAWKDANYFTLLATLDPDSGGKK